MSYKRWTEAETAYIRENCKTMSDAEMGAALKRSAGAVANARRNMRLGKQVPWTQDEEEYLQEMWGSRSIPAIAKHLGRTVNAVKVRVARLGLGPSLMRQSGRCGRRSMISPPTGTEAGGMPLTGLNLCSCAPERSTNYLSGQSSELPS